MTSSSSAAPRSRACRGTTSPGGCRGSRWSGGGRRRQRRRRRPHYSPVNSWVFVNSVYRRQHVRQSLSVTFNEKFLGLDEELTWSDGFTFYGNEVVRLELIIGVSFFENRIVQKWPYLKWIERYRVFWLIEKESLQGFEWVRLIYLFIIKHYLISCH